MSACSLQNIGDFGVIAAKGLVERSVAKHVFAVDIDSLGDQELDDQSLAVGSSQMEGAAIVVVAKVKVVYRTVVSDLVQVALTYSLKNFGNNLRRRVLRWRVVWFAITSAGLPKVAGSGIWG